ncbi:alpha/beta hydrolase [Phenylobacterium sp.]|uniref:alpha/beta hydrolase n=1 Tax=Phenylobacterium sp. TaxID=1871053 RepID=UPI00120082A7|nr:alpha/beta hydrolase [Phenylobacterium sp.]THD64631.1 MAG: alpha/beta hydrolase [Phenylobacterium sp.]
MRTKFDLAALAFAAAIWAAPALAADLPAIPLYAPGALPAGAAPEHMDNGLLHNVSQPSLTPVLPAPGKANGQAVIVAPGGGFLVLSWENEGMAVARRLADAGVTAFVLKYRVGPTPSEPAAFMKYFGGKMGELSAMAARGEALPPPFPTEGLAAADAAEAVKLVRRRAAEWQVDPHRVGFVGFSAGAITAASIATGEPAGRPDFVGIIYGALRNPVPKDAPPAFIATAADDGLVKAYAAPMFQAWKAAGRPAELHIFERGGHGFGMNRQGSTSDHWLDEFLWWIQDLKP